MTDIIDIIEPLSGFCDDTICDETIVNFWRQLKFKQYDYISCFLYNQKSINYFNPSYSIYKLNLSNSHFEHHIDVNTNVGNEYHTAIQLNETHLLLHILSCETLINYIIEHSDGRKYIILPLIMSVESEKTTHATCLAIDIINKNSYLIDANGNSS